MRQATYLDFPVDEYRRRLAALRQHMAESGLDAVFVTMRDSVEFLSGFTTVSWRLIDKRFWLVVPLEGEPALTVDIVHEGNVQETSWVEDVRLWGKDGKGYIDRLVEIFHDLGLEDATVGMELGLGTRAHMALSDFDEIRRRLPNFKAVDASRVLSNMRRVKSAREIERIESASVICCQGIEAAFRDVRRGTTEQDIVRMIVTEWLRLGAESPYNSNNEGYLAVQSGRVHQMTPSTCKRPVGEGDLIQVDACTVFRGYACDTYRNAFVGEPTPEIQKYAEGCAYIQSTTVNAIRPGMTSAEICVVSDNAIDEIGFGPYRRVLMDANSAKKGSMIGHGLGFNTHDLPFISPRDETPWIEGMCGALEISFGDPANGYIIWEDTFVVTNDGVRILTPMAKQLWLI